MKLSEIAGITYAMGKNKLHIYTNGDTAIMDEQH
jgi:hypothetical protein